MYFFLFFWFPVKVAGGLISIMFVDTSKKRKSPASCCRRVATGNCLLPFGLCWCDGTSGSEQRAVWVYCADMNSTESNGRNTREAAIRQTAQHLSAAPVHKPRQDMEWIWEALRNTDILFFPCKIWLKVKSHMEAALEFWNKKAQLEKNHLSYRWVTPFFKA